MIKSINDIKIGTLIKVYMANGQMFMGALRDVNDGILIVSALGEYIKIQKPENIQAFSFVPSKSNEETPIKERNSQDETPEHTPGDIESLTQLRILKAQAEKEQYRNRILSPNITTPEIAYASPIHALLAAQKHPNK